MAKKLAFDRLLFTTIIVLVGLGLVMVYSASSALVRGHEGWNPFLAKQAVAAAIGFVAMLVAMHLDYRRLRDARFIYAALGGVTALLVAVLFSPPLNGTRRWFVLSSLSLQPSELAKLVLVPFLAYQLARKLDAVNSRALLVPAAAATGLLAGLIVLEPDLGTAALIVVTAAAILFLAGLSWRFVGGGILLAMPLLAALVFSAHYRRTRFFAFLAPEKDPLGAGFQALQSLIAVGSGGLAGLGPGNSVQKLYFLPYPQTDFVYAIVAEELGMIGALAVVALFALVVWRGARAGLRAPDPFGRFLAWGFTAVVGIQAFLNVSVAIALLPTKGIPLPFLSYGGSSLVATMAACGVILNVSQHG